MDLLFESKLFSFFLIVAGITWIINGYRKYQEIVNLEKNGVRTQGKIIDFAAIEDNEDDTSSSTMYYPIVEYFDENGKGYATKLSIGSSMKPRSKAKIYELLYDPKRPTKVSLVSESSNSFLPLLISIFGFIICLFGLLILLN